MNVDPTFIPAARLLKIEGGMHDILRSITQREWKEPDCDAIAVHTHFTGGWYLFEPRFFFQRAREFLDLSKSQQTLKHFQDIFDIHEYRALPEVSPGIKATAPAIVLVPGNALHGAWMRPTKLDTDDVDVIRGAAEQKDSALRRTPHMDFSTAPPMAPGSEFEVEVFADDSVSSPDEEIDLIVLPGTANEFELSVWLARSAELEVIGPNDLPLRIVRDEARSSSAKFRVKVLNEAQLGRLAALTASFSYQGRPCGRVTRSVLIGAPGTVAPAEAEARTRDFSGGVRVENNPPPPADLIIVVACPDDKADHYDVKVTTPWLDDFKKGVSKPWPLPTAAGDMVRGKMANFTKGGISNKQRLDNLLGAGQELFEASPKHFRDAFWELIRRKAPLKTIYILSEEPHVPWELMVPVPEPGDDDGREWKPLGVEFAIGRWVHKGHLSPPGSVSLKSACVLAPDYKNSQQTVLENAAAESAYVCEKFGGKPFTPARYQAIRNRISTEMAPLFHFVGHGSIVNENDEQFALEQDETFSATEARGMASFRDAIRKMRPMVFLNACEVGRPIPTLIGAGGFPRTFAQLGASAIVAPLWSVRDGCAHKVAVALYDAVREDAGSGVKPRSVCEILRGIRARAYSGEDEGEDSYAAYCFYGDPFFVLSVPSTAMANNPTP